MKRMPIAIAALAVVVMTLFTRPRTFWQGEEVRFAQALLTFDPVHRQPEPPGYPLYVAIGRLLNFFVHEPFTTLLVLSVIACGAGAVLTGLAAAELLGSDSLGAAAVIVLYFSPAMLVFAPLPNAEAAGVALIAAALLWSGVFAGAAIGVLPQVAPAMLVFFRRRPRTAAATLALIFIPFFEWIPPSYVTKSLALPHGFAVKELLLRFVAHPWGAKWLSVPLLIVAAIGCVMTIRRVWPLLVFAAIHLIVCFGFGDPLAGVEPVIPAMIAVAILFAAAFSRWPRVAIVAAIAYAAGSVVYAWPVLELRRASPSPPARAMRDARQSLPPRAVLICDDAMEPWGRLSRFNIASSADFDRYADVLDVPLYLAADGNSHAPGAHVFSWPASDAYGKMATERYRVVSIVPLPPAMRYRSMGGVYAFERTADGGEGRWLAGEATIALPRIGARVIHLRLGLPVDAPFDQNVITVGGTTVTVPRGRSVDVSFASASPLRIHAAQTFTSRRDGRTLSVQLLLLEQR
ncbi:MAG TPA: hypothetical protein VLV78_19185 [Thermoanaerobaculia bacterium]|nr:hypothetical protein [Thermoanaerobaculia bacterium]